MSRPRRSDRPGALHHVTNRGPGHRLLFNGAADTEVFLGLLERASRERGLEIHSFCIMGTHFHLLVSTRDGDLSAVLGWVEDLYARYFNRTRDRDGHVLKARFWSHEIDDAVYLVLVISYIDRNPVAAELVEHPGEHPYSSARAYLGDPVFPWLRRDVVEQAACRIAGRSLYSADLYPRLWGACAPEIGDPLIARTDGYTGVRIAPIGALLRAGPQHVQRWLRDAALREEGKRGLMLALSASQVDALAAATSSHCHNLAQVGVLPLREPNRILRAGLLHSLAGQTLDAIATKLGISRTQVSVAVARHRDALQLSPYATLVAERVERALREAYAGALW